MSINKLSNNCLDQISFARKFSAKIVTKISPLEKEQEKVLDNKSKEINVLEATIMRNNIINAIEFKNPDDKKIFAGSLYV